MSDKDKQRSHKVYQWARLQIGKRVGGGECWDLADRALRHAGARSSTTTGREDNYDWGTPVKAVQDVIPGDILQFRDHVVRTIVTNTSPKGTEETWSDTIRPHHTAIVEANNGAKGIVILEQNLYNQEPVKRRVLYLTNGVIKRESKPSVSVVVTTRVEVTGLVWAYRAEAKK